MLNDNVKVFTTDAILIPSVALKVRVADPSYPSEVAESDDRGVMVTTDES